MSASPAKSKARIKGLLVLVILIAAAAAGIYYYMLGPAVPSKFTLTVEPRYIHMTPGWGQNLTVNIARYAGFAGNVQVGLVNGPNWALFTPITIHAPETNGTLFVIADKTAPKGSLDLNVRASAGGSTDQTVTVTMKVIGVFNASSPSGTAEVYETTKALDNATMAALTSYDKSSGAIQFSEVTPVLQGLEPGDVIVGPPTTPVAPNGFLRTVLNTQETGGGLTVNTRQATIFEAFRQLHIGAGPSGSPGTLGTQSIRPDTDIPLLPSTTYKETEDLGSGYNMGVSLTIEAHAFFGIDMAQWTEDACLATAYAYSPAAGLACFAGAFLISKVYFFEVNFDAHEVADAWIKGPQSGDISWGPKDLEHLFGPTTLPILSPYLWIDINGKLEASVNGHLSQPTNMEATQTFDLAVGPKYCNTDYCRGPGPPGGGDCNGWCLHATTTPSFTLNLEPGVGNSGDNLRGEFGPRVDLEIDGGVAGGSLSAHFFLLYGVQTPAPPSVPCDAFDCIPPMPSGAGAWLNGGLDAEAGLNFLFHSVDFESGALDIVEFNIWSAAPVDRPPTVQINTPANNAVLDFTHGQGLGSQFSATVTDPEGDNICGGQVGSVVWVSSLDRQIGVGCSPIVLFNSPGTHLITVTATDSGGKVGTATVTVTVKLPAPPQLQVSVTCVQSSVNVCNVNQAYENEPVQLHGNAIIIDPSTLFTYPVSCQGLTWTVFSSSQNIVFSQSGICDVSWTPTATDTYAVTLSVTATYSGQTYTGKAGPDTIIVVTPPANQNMPPDASITSPPASSDFSQPQAPIQLSGVILDEPESETVTWSWTANWGGTSVVSCGPTGCPALTGYTYAIASGTASPPFGYNLPDSQISYSWDVHSPSMDTPSSAICNDPDFSAVYQGLANGVQLVLTVTDSAQGSNTYAVQITLGCQTLPAEISTPFSTSPSRMSSNGLGRVQAATPLAFRFPPAATARILQSYRIVFTKNCNMARRSKLQNQSVRTVIAQL